MAGCESLQQYAYNIQHTCTLCINHNRRRISLKMGGCGPCGLGKSGWIFSPAWPRRYKREVCVRPKHRSDQELWMSSLSINAFVRRKKCTDEMQPHRSFSEPCQCSAKLDILTGSCRRGIVDEDRPAMRLRTD